MKTNLSLYVGVAALASPMEVGADRAEQAAADLGRVLESAGCSVVNVGAIKNAEQARKAGLKFAESHVSCVALAAASWFEDYLVLDLLEECNVPVLFWALPGMETGALCGVQQVTCYLKQLEKPFQAVFGEIGAGPSTALRAGEQLGRCMSFLRASALNYSLRRARIGIAGQHVRGMTEVAVNEIALKKTFGCRVVPVDMVGLLRLAREADAKEKKQAWEKVKSLRNPAKPETACLSVATSVAKTMEVKSHMASWRRRIKKAVTCLAVSDEAGMDSAGIYLAIKKIVADENLSALAFGCYPDYMGFACLAASLLADEGVPVACEGDINGAVGMLILQALTGQPTHNTDCLDPLPDGSVVFSHCGSSSYSLADKKAEIKLAKVRLANQGVCSLFPAKPGPVTLVSLLPKGDGYQMAVLEGEALPTNMVFPGNPLRVKFTSRNFNIVVGVADPGPASAKPATVAPFSGLNLNTPANDVVDWIFAEGIGHHWIAGYGHVRAEIKDLTCIIGAKLLLLK